MIINVEKDTREKLLNLYKSRGIYLEGNILKLISYETEDEEFNKYILESIKRDKDNRKKRLTFTKQVQYQNSELIKEKEENEIINDKLKKALNEAEISKNEAINAKQDAEKARNEAESARLEAEFARIEAEKARENAINDLDLLQKRTQFELMGRIVKVALLIILGVGVVVTLLFSLSMYLNNGKAESDIFNTWSNIIGIMLTNAFSIVGTIMGVKYASEKESKKE